MEASLTVWPVQDAKARFSELLDSCLANGPQTISRRGLPEAVIVPLDQWQRITSKQPTLKELLLEDSGRFTMDLPVRGQGRHRQIEDE
jgi:prevent-host-death family protein